MRIHKRIAQPSTLKGSGILIALAVHVFGPEYAELAAAVVAALIAAWDVLRDEDKKEGHV